MNIFAVTFQSIAILLIIGIVGFSAISRRVVPLKILDVISPLIIEISVPALIFVNILTRFDPSSLPDWYKLPIWWIGYTAIILILIFLVGFVVKKPEFKLGLLYPNSIFLPIALIPEIFTTNSSMLIELFIFTLLAPVFVFNSYFYFYKQKEKFNFKKLFNPILVATIVSLFLVLTGLNSFVPEIIVKGAKMLGGLALPLVMIMIGGNIYVDFKRRGKVNVKLIVKFLFFRNILFPAIIFTILLFVRPTSDISFLIFLMTIVPPLTAIPIIVQKAKGDVAISNQFIVSSLLFSVVSIPLWLMLYSEYFEIVF